MTLELTRPARPAGKSRWNSSLTRHGAMLLDGCLLNCVCLVTGLVGRLVKRVQRRVVSEDCAILAWSKNQGGGGGIRETIPGFLNATPPGEWFLHSDGQRWEQFLTFH